MSFEPKIFEDGDPNQPVWDDAEQLNLPDELAMFAEQLRDDAAYLALRHPADATTEQREASWHAHVASEQVTPRWNWRMISVAAAMLLVTTVGSWTAWRWQQSDSITTTRTTSLDDNSQRVRVVQPIRTHGDEVPVDFSPTVEQPRVVPASFLREVTGPELDGMLDLLQQDESGLSI